MNSALVASSRTSHFSSTSCSSSIGPRRDRKDRSWCPRTSRSRPRAESPGAAARSRSRSHGGGDVSHGRRAGRLPPDPNASAIERPRCRTRCTRRRGSLSRAMRRPRRTSSVPVAARRSAMNEVAPREVVDVTVARRRRGTGRARQSAVFRAFGARRVNETSPIGAVRVRLELEQPDSERCRASWQIGQRNHSGNGDDGNPDPCVLAEGVVGPVGLGRHAGATAGAPPAGRALAGRLAGAAPRRSASHWPSSQSSSPSTITEKLGRSTTAPTPKLHSSWLGRSSPTRFDGCGPSSVLAASVGRLPCGRRRLLLLVE